MLYGRIEFIKEYLRTTEVLILIFLENALRPYMRDILPGDPVFGLNPYFFGKCSTAYSNTFCYLYTVNVLILIFLENALRQIELLVKEEGVFTS